MEVDRLAGIGRAGRLAHPARVIPMTFLLAIALGTALLMLPAAKAGKGAHPS
ncbi:hypothetical protein ruthe_00929 [Rubellimicrobium thermophilum DSM 16684]|uniref:Uncharacterized protein n=1 Tax=Rubellimicrobium thermophilum DSM 16684 TaxID=1123069 RepID=S9S7I1_9RHOB|nr:hypothetical protein [Rubellimicrobium thermophilum]EPX86120.1 hypothetical protein ruthe_00929 [Rubellimicrobium thermophilum DSM 16684]